MQWKCSFPLFNNYKRLVLTLLETFLKTQKKTLSLWFCLWKRPHTQVHVSQKHSGEGSSWVSRHPISFRLTVSNCSQSTEKQSACEVQLAAVSIASNILQQQVVPAGRAEREEGSVDTCQVKAVWQVRRLLDGYEVMIRPPAAKQSGVIKAKLLAYLMFEFLFLGFFSQNSRAIFEWDLQLK